METKADTLPPGTTGSTTVPLECGERAAPPTTTDRTLVPSSVWFGPFVPDGLERDFMAFLGTHNGVAILTWPRDRAHCDHLTRAGLPRLLLVCPTTATPPVEPLQDWLPSGASYTEIHDRLVALTRAAAERRRRAGPPTLDDQGQLHVGDASVAVPGPERALAQRLATGFEAPVAIAELTTAISDPSPASLQVRLWQLGRRLNPLGLEIASVPDGSYVLRRAAVHTVTDTGPAPARIEAATPPVSGPEPVRAAAPPRTLRPRRTLPMHFRSGLLAPNLP